jgi:Arc/MetJ-type ribon-helix-helix transcriptional regulator
MAGLVPAICALRVDPAEVVDASLRRYDGDYAPKGRFQLRWYDTVIVSRRAAGQVHLQEASGSIYHPVRWRTDGMASVQELRPRGADSEKITINLGFVDLGHIDLMVRDGFYANRTDFIRTAIRNQLDRHADVVRQSVARKTLALGLCHYTRLDLEAARDRGEMLDINVLGLATIASDVTAELARAAIGSITVLGALHASAEVRGALADRMH